jgi:hypothetical protein
MARTPSVVFSDGGKLKSQRAGGFVLQSRPQIPPRRAGLEPLDRRLRKLSLHELPGAGVELLRVAVRRSRAALACPCGGQAERSRCTHAEIARFGGEGFARAFVCGACHTRFVGRAKPM